MDLPLKEIHRKFSAGVSTCTTNLVTLNRPICSFLKQLLVLQVLEFEKYNVGSSIRLHSANDFF